MSENRKELFELLLEAEKREIIKCSPSLTKYTFEEICNLEENITAVLSKKNYLITFNYDIEIATSTQKVEKVNRGCSLIVDLLNEIFNSYNILVVPHAKLNTDSENFKNQIKKVLSSIIESDIEYSFNISDCEESVDSPKIQLGYSIEIKDTISGTMDISHFYSKCYVTIENGEPAFYYDIEFIPDESNGIKLNKAEIEKINKPYYIKLVKNIISSLSKDEMKMKMMENTVNTNTEIKEFLDKKLEEARKNNVLNPQIDFNIIPVSISLNKAQSKKLTLKLSKGQKSATSDFENFDVLKISDNKLHCPCCGAEIDDGNYLTLLKTKGNKYIIGCYYCEAYPSAPLYEEPDDFDEINPLANAIDYSEKYDKNALVVDPSEDCSYYIDDCVYCDVSETYYYKENMVAYDVLANPNEHVQKSKMAFKVYVRQCSNCHTMVAGTEVELNKYFIEDVDTDNVVCCERCVDNEHSFVDSENKISFDKSYYRSEISGKAFTEGNGKYAVSEISGRIGGISEFVRCNICGDLVACDEVDNKGICNECSSLNPSEAIIPPKEVIKYLEKIYSVKMPTNTKWYEYKNAFDLKEYRFVGKYYGCVTLGDEGIVSSKLKMRGR